jgi:hypothetical protein
MISCYEENLGSVPAGAQLFSSALAMQVCSLIGDTFIVAANLPSFTGVKQSEWESRVLLLLRLKIHELHFDSLYMPLECSALENSVIV